MPKPKFRFAYRYETNMLSGSGETCIIPTLVFYDRVNDSYYAIAAPAFWAGFKGFQDFCVQWVNGRKS